LTTAIKLQDNPEIKKNIQTPQNNNTTRSTTNKLAYITKRPLEWGQRTKVYRLFTVIFCGKVVTKYTAAP